MVVWSPKIDKIFRNVYYLIVKEAKKHPIIETPKLIFAKKGPFCGVNSLKFYDWKGPVSRDLFPSSGAHRL